MTQVIHTANSKHACIVEAKKVRTPEQPSANHNQRKQNVVSCPDSHHSSPFTTSIRTFPDAFGSSDDSTMSPPHILIGSGTWGHGFSIDQVRDQLNRLGKLQCRQIDTAALYPFPSPGTAEEFIGEIGHEGLLVDTKAMWFDNGDNTLTMNAVQKSIDESLKRLKASKVRQVPCIGTESQD